MSFRRWLEEEIDWKGQECPRWRCIRMFVNDGLVPFVKSRGYEFAVPPKQLANLLASGFFANQGRSHVSSVWSCPLQPDGAYPEDEAHFHYILHRELWDSFWSEWGRWTDVDPAFSYRGSDRRLDCEILVWSQMDLEASPQTGNLLEIMAGGEEDDAPGAVALPSHTGRQGIDTYILDAAEFGGWGGYRKP
jgi:hypothetical protein